MDAIEISGIRCYGYTGYLPEEQVLGQWFELDLELGVDLSAAGRSDALGDTLDYSQLITALQQQARSLSCQTLEHYSERIFERIEELYGPVPVRIELRKCQAPVSGFDGVVAVRRSRHH